MLFLPNFFCYFLLELIATVQYKCTQDTVTFLHNSDTEILIRTHMMYNLQEEITYTLAKIHPHISYGAWKDAV